MWEQHIKVKTHVTSPDLRRLISESWTVGTCSSGSSGVTSPAPLQNPICYFQCHNDIITLNIIAVFSSLVKKKNKKTLKSLIAIHHLPKANWFIFLIKPTFCLWCSSHIVSCLTFYYFIFNNLLLSAFYVFSVPQISETHLLLLMEGRGLLFFLFFLITLSFIALCMEGLCFLLLLEYSVTFFGWKVLFKSSLKSK